MRNPHYTDNGRTKSSAPAQRPRGHGRGLTPLAWLAMLALVGIPGCTPDPTLKALDSASRTVESSPDAALSAADAYLDKNPAGPAAARAWYVKGRTYESRRSASAAEAQSNLRLARQAYGRGLALKPGGQLEALTRSGLANVAYFQDDYATALEQWATAYAGLSDRHDSRAWTLYRIGLCQQRLGRFDQADRTFARVQSEHAGTIPAARAAEKRGYRQFFVQLGVFDKQANARAALDAAKKAGIPGAQLARDSHGRDILRAGPAASYADAKTLLLRITRLPQYAQSLIVP